MASYKLLIKPSAAKEIEFAPKKDRLRIVKRIQDLSSDPLLRVRKISDISRGWAVNSAHSRPFCKYNMATEIRVPTPFDGGGDVPAW